MYSHALEWEDLPRSWPGLPSAQSLVSTSSLSPALPGAVSVHVTGGGLMKWERKPVGEEGEKEQVTSGSYSAFTAFFLAAPCRGGISPAQHLMVGAEVRSSVQVPHGCELFSQHKLARPVPWCWSGLDALCQVTQHSPDGPPTAEPHSPAFPRLGPRHPTLSPEGRIPAHHRTAGKLGLVDG